MSSSPSLSVRENVDRIPAVAEKGLPEGGRHSEEVRATKEADSRQGQHPGRLAEGGSQGYEEDRPARPRQGLRHAGDSGLRDQEVYFHR